MNTLPPMPARIARLPRDARGFPVPWFTAWRDGVPDFTTIDTPKIGEAHRKKRCFICGEPLGSFKCFTIGPMCTVNRVSSEPPSHLECAEFAASTCPFLTKPRMKRLPKPDGALDPPGIHFDRNPGVTALWSTRSYELQRVHGGHLFALGPPTAVEWYREGRAATLDEVSEAVATGLPALAELAEAEGEGAMRDLLAAVQQVMPLLPRLPDGTVAHSLGAVAADTSRH